MTMPNVAIIGASCLQLPLIEKAKAMGYTTHVFAWAADDVGERAADVFHPISIVEKERILDVCREVGICGICTIASDLAVVAVNYVAEKLGLIGNGIETTLRCTNKHAMREAFAARHDPSPKSVLLDGTTDLAGLALAYPIIVKPTDRSGSRAVCKLEDGDGLAEAVRRAMDASFEKKAVVEEFVEGREYSVEYISYRGQHTFLALTEKHTTGAPHFIETCHVEPAPVSDATLANVRRIIPHALDTLGIRYGASHSEIKIDDNGNVRLIEIGARGGGDSIATDLVSYATGYDFVKMILQVACGDAPDFTKIHDPTPVESVFLFTEADVQALDDLRKHHPEKLVRVVDFHPENIGKTTDSSNRAGCYIRRV